MARVEVYTRPGCHLCEVAIEVVAAVCADLGVEWAEIDINTAADLVREHGEYVPVTVIDGARHDIFRVDEARLRNALS